jgi:hypothetical protein
MQKLINVVALLSGLTSAALIGGSGYLLLNKDALIESARSKAIEEVTKTVTEALPGMISGAMPELPGATGNVIPESATSVPSVTGGAIPY